MIHTYVDILLLAIVLLAVLRGWQAGAIYGLIALAAWIGSVLAAFRWYGAVARWLAVRTNWPAVWDRPAAFMGTLVIAGLVINLVGAAFASRLPKVVHRQPTNRLLGIIPGLINGLISAAITAALLLALPLPGSFGDAVRGSALAARFAATTERVEAALTPIFGDAITQTLTMLTVKPESDETVALPFAVTDARPRPDLEAEMLELINGERVKAGLAPLAADPALTEVARAHSADMLARKYFGHNTPEGATPFDRIDAAGVPYRTAGENLALAPTLSLAHTGLMNSPGHRENILRPEFGRVGIGILDAGLRGLMITQNFRN
jgi:uncharacterized protein YkwD/uncharacterized membrane protein required for colicin V production